MSTKAQIMKMLEKIPDGEPLFLLRGQDRLASGLVKYWAGAATARGVPPKKIDEAKVCAIAMEQWKPRKWPD